MSFWDGTRWIPADTQSGRTLSREDGRGWITILAMLLLMTALPVPSQPSAAGGQPPRATPTSGMTGKRNAIPGSGLQPNSRPQQRPVTVPTVSPKSRAQPRPAAQAGLSFVRRSNGRLVVNGQHFVFTGTNIYNANSTGTCGYDMQSGTTLGDSLTELGNGQAVFRAWFFQRLATSDGVRDWQAFDHTLSVARAHGQRVVITLANQWGDCENVTGRPTYKSEAWYRSGYRESIDPGALVTYRSWVREIVLRYRDDPTILAWQLMNEAEALSSSGGRCTSTAAASVEAWATDISSLVKSLDTNHLVSLGTIGTGQCGTSTGDSFERLHALPGIDLCEYHDYDQPEAMPGDSWNGLRTRLAQCRALGKPMFIGELGLKSDRVGGVIPRAAMVGAKLEAQFAAGVVGILFWDWRTAQQGGSSGGGYEIGPGDPVLNLFGR